MLGQIRMDHAIGVRTAWATSLLWTLDLFFRLVAYPLTVAMLGTCKLTWGYFALPFFCFFSASDWFLVGRCCSSVLNVKALYCHQITTCPSSSHFHPSSRATDYDIKATQRIHITLERGSSGDPISYLRTLAAPRGFRNPYPICFIIRPPGCLVE